MVNIKEFITSVVAIILLFVCSACESAVAPTNPNDSDLGNVEFVVDFNQNNEGDESQNKGDGTAESPAQVTEAEPLNVVVSQESSYTDPNGTVYTCEPKASVEVVALEKRVYAEDIEALTKISEDIEVTNHYLAIGFTANPEETGASFTGSWMSADDWKLELISISEEQSEYTNPFEDFDTTIEPEEKPEDPDTAVEMIETAPVVKGIYDLYGRRLDAITAPGLYIVNGKKVLVR